jgi:hypothetical protein
MTLVHMSSVYIITSYSFALNCVEPNSEISRVIEIGRMISNIYVVKVCNVYLKLAFTLVMYTFKVNVQQNRPKLQYLRCCFLCQKWIFLISSK